MNNDSTTPPTNRKKIVMIALGVLLAIIVVGGLVAYGLKMWPQQTSAPSKDTNEAVSSKTTPPAVDPKADAMFADIKFKTTEQGDCTLTISNKTNSVTYVNSTKGLSKEFTGCLNWNIDTKSIPPGDYDVNVVFKGATKTLTYDKKLTIK